MAAPIDEKIPGPEPLPSMEPVQTLRPLPANEGVVPPTGPAPIPGAAIPNQPLPTEMTAGDLADLVPGTAPPPQPNMAERSFQADPGEDPAAFEDQTMSLEDKQTDKGGTWNTIRNTIMGRVSVEEAQRDLGYQGHTVPAQEIPEAHIQMLRANHRTDPAVIEAFEYKHGKGSAAQFTRFASEDHRAMISGPSPDPAAVEAFDHIYGKGMARWYNMLSSPDIGDRTRAANELKSILLEGKNFEQRMEEGKTGDLLRGIAQGSNEAVINTANTFIWLGNGIFGSDVQKIDLPKDVLADNPTLYKVTKAVSQLTVALSGGYAATAGVAPGASWLAQSVRATKAGALADLFAFDPNDPLLIELFGKGKEFSDAYLSKGEGARRLLRAAEGGLVGTAIDGTVRVAGGMWRLLRASKAQKAAEAAGDTAAAARHTNEMEAAKEEIAKTIEDYASKFKKAPGKGVEARPVAAKEAEVVPPPNPQKTLSEAAKDAMTPAPLREVQEVLQAKAIPARPVISPDDVLGTLKTFTQRITDDIPWADGSRALRLEDVGPAVASHVDDFRSLGWNRSTMRQAFDAAVFNPTEQGKIQGLINQSAKQVTEDITETAAKLEVARGSKDSWRVIELEKKLSALVEEKAIYDVYDAARGSAASKAMNLQRATNSIVGQPAVRVRVDELRKLGKSDEEIAELITGAIHGAKRGPVGSAIKKLQKMDLNLARATRDLEDLIKNGGSDSAVAASRRYVDNLQRQVDEQLARVTRLGAKAADGWLKKISNVLTELKLSALLYSAKTVALVQYAGGLSSIGMYNLSRTLGATMRGGLGAGIRDVYARQIAFKAVANGGMDNMLYHTFKNAGRAFRKEGSWLLKNEDAMGIGQIGKYISSDYLGGGAVMDAAGKIVRLPGQVLSFNDDLMGTYIARTEIASRAASEFYDLLRKQAKQQRMLGTPEGAAAARGIMRNKKALVAGKEMGFEEYIQKQIGEAFDSKTGALLSKKDKSLVEEILLKNPFEGKYGQVLETLATHPAAKLAFLPFFRTPIRAIQRGFHYTPLTAFTNKFREEMLGKHGRAAQEYALGRFAIGTAITYYLYDKIFNSEEIVVTGSGPVSYKEKRAWEQGGWKANSIKIGGEWYDYSNLEPLSTAIKVMANIKQSYDIHNLRKIEDKDKKAEEGFMQTAMFIGMASTGAILQAFTDSGMLAGVKKATDMVKIAGEASDRGAAAKEVGLKFAAEQARSFVPAQLKAYNAYIDPRLKDVMNPLEVWSMEFGDRDAVSNQYDVFGNPKLDSNPAARLIGVLSPVKTKEVDKMTPNEKTKYLMGRIAMITGKNFEHPTDIPEIKGLDLRSVKSPDGKGTMFDSFMGNYKSTKINGYTVEEALNAITKRGIGMSPEDIRTAKLKMPIGNADFDGTLAEQYTRVIQNFRKKAWVLTRNSYKEQKVPDVVKRLNELGTAKKNRNNLGAQPYDRQQPPPIIGFTGR